MVNTYAYICILCFKKLYRRKVHFKVALKDEKLHFLHTYIVLYFMARVYARAQRIQRKLRYSKIPFDALFPRPTFQCRSTSMLWYCCYPKVYQKYLYIYLSDTSTLKSLHHKNTIEIDSNPVESSTLQQE